MGKKLKNEKCFNIDLQIKKKKNHYHPKSSVYSSMYIPKYSKQNHSNLESLIKTKSYPNTQMKNNPTKRTKSKAYLIHKFFYLWPYRIISKNPLIVKGKGIRFHWIAQQSHNRCVWVLSLTHGDRVLNKNTIQFHNSRPTK